MPRQTSSAQGRLRVPSLHAAAAHLEATMLAGFEEDEITAILGLPEPELQSFAPWLAPAPADAVQQAFLLRCRELTAA